VLHKHGIGIRQVFDGQMLKTQMLHESGTCVDSVLPCPDDGLNPQDFGKKITYYRRYAIVAMLGLAPDDDDDAAGVGAPPRQPAPAPTPPPAADSRDHKTAAAQEREAYASEAYERWADEDVAALLERELLDGEIDSDELRWETWRTRRADRRAEMKLT